jgi:hypothetical protein
MVMYPVGGYQLEEDQYTAIIRAAKTVGETTFFVSVVERAGDLLEHDDHWLCRAAEYAEYKSLPLVLENALYSVRGGWGAIVSHEQHVMVGGSDFFIQLVKKHYPRWREDLRELLEYWEGNPNSGWLEDIILCLGDT